MSKLKLKPRKAKRARDMECAFQVVEENGEPQLYVVLDGRRIAKRGHPDSAQARTWVSLEPGFRVLDGEKTPDGGDELVIYQDGVAIN